jgi:hypothetical protein
VKKINIVLYLLGRNLFKGHSQPEHVLLEDVQVILDAVWRVIAAF